MSRDILLALVDPDPEQPRKHFDPTQLDELAQSMAANGLAVPILVRPTGERYIIVHGERRYRAALALGWETIAANVRDVAPADAPWLALIENIQRADLSPIEEARAHRAHLDAGMTQQALGERIGKSQSHIATKLRYLKLEPEIQQALATGGISEGHAKQLLRLEHSGQRLELCEEIQREQLSVKRAAEIVDSLLRPMTAQERATLAHLEANIYEAGATLAAAGRATRAIRAGLTPAQFEVWARSRGWDMETANDYAALDDTGMNWTERMIDDLKLRHNPIAQTAISMSRDMPTD